MLKDKVKDIPHKPGIYKFIDKQGVVLYVGKAKDLRNRVAQYFGTSDYRHQLPLLLSEAVDIEYTVVHSELESLFLESTLIKEYMPPYNIKLRDDKDYAFIKIDYASSEIPQITYVRKVSDDAKSKRAQSKYFGPYSSTAKIHKTLDLVRRIFPYCANKEIGKRPCFYYYLHRCPGICIGAITLQEYQTQLDKISLFLAGHTTKIKRALQAEMRGSAKKKLFETAARLRDQLKAIEVIEERQTILFATKVDWDFISFFNNQDSTCVNVFKVRGGKLLDKENFIYDSPLHTPEGNRDNEILQTFTEMYYATATDLPEEIYTQSKLTNPDLLKTLLRSRAENQKVKHTIKLNSPTRGQKLKLIKLGVINAKEYLLKWQRSQTSNLDVIKETLENLKQILNLPTTPRRIEGYDISNTQGTNPVGSMVVVKDGRAVKSEYRKFKITSKHTPDDFTMMQEMLTRRLTRINPENKTEKWPIPDLLVIDGGKGQLSVAVKALKQAGLFTGKNAIPVIGLAKRIEEIFIPNDPKPIILPHDNPVLQLLQRLRDEAHRFGITFHRSLRNKQATKSALDTIPGIGPKTKKLLKEKFGTINNIKRTRIEELTKLIGRAKAQTVLENLN